MTYLQSPGPIRFMYISGYVACIAPQMHALLGAMQAVNILDLIRKQAELQPNNVAFACVDSNESISYADLIRRVNAVADWLRGRGCQPFDRCGLHCPEGSEFLISALGILSAGLAIAPVSLNVLPLELDRIIGAAGLNWLLETEKKLIRFPFAGFVDNQANDRYEPLSRLYQIHFWYYRPKKRSFVRT